MRRADLEFNVQGLNFKPFRTGDKLQVGSLSIEPVHVDHSVPGAYGFVIHTSHGAIVYTGDFRIHGTKPEMTRGFVVKAKKAEPAAIVCEATNMTGASISPEAEVEGKLDNIVRQSEGIVLAEFAYADIDRLNSFFRIAKTNDRCLDVLLRRAYLLHTLRADKHLNVPDLKNPSILIFRKSKVTNYKWEKQIMQEYAGKVKDAFEVSKQQCKTILTLSFYDFEELVDIKPQAGSCYIVSSSEPFNEEMQIDFEKLVNWLKHYGLPQYHVHVSGHVIPIQLRAIVEEINAQKTFPIHTEHPDLFARFVGDLKSKIVPTEKDVEYRI